jgi:hypothetical protein
LDWATNGFRVIGARYRLFNKTAVWGREFPFSGQMLNSAMSRMNFFAAIAVGLGFFFSVALAEPTPSPAAGTGLEGVIVISPAHPGPTREGASDPVPLARTDFIVQKGDATLASFTTDEKGAFRISLPPGHYSVSRKASLGRIGHFGPFETDVVEGQMTKVNWTCDSGMR